MRITLSTLQKMARQGEKIAMLTCYDASFAQLIENAGVEVLLVGDSLGMVLQGNESTLQVTVGDMAYHTRCVARGSKQAFIISDMPFGSYHLSPQQAFENAALLIAAGAHMVKLEGGETMAETITFLTKRGIPVCAHLGLTPQSIHQIGGYRVQGLDDEAAQRILRDAKILQEAGASEVTASLDIPVIGIGAGQGCSGQVLVLHDMLDVYPGRKARFVKNFLQGSDSIQQAVAGYVSEVKAKTFPGPEHSF
jgi:3-methyl-2-oxobutanoate hydroxymethyltransferase